MILAAGLLWALCLNSQAGDGFFSTEKSDEGVKAELRGGLAVSKMAAKDDNSSIKGNRRLGFSAGLALDIPILKSLAVETGLHYVQKGMKEKDTSTGTLIEGTGNPGYLEVPLLVSYRYAFKKKIQLQVSTGPFLAVGISGKMKLRQDVGTGKMQKLGEMDWFGNEEDLSTARFRRFDMGWHIGARMRFLNRFSVGYSFEAGFLDTARNMGYKVKSRSHLVNFGFII